MANPHGRPRSETVKLTKTARERFDRQLAEKLPDIFTALFEAGTKEKNTAALSLLVNRAVPVRKGVPVNFKTRPLSNPTECAEAFGANARAHIHRIDGRIHDESDGTHIGRYGAACAAIAGKRSGRYRHPGQRDVEGPDQNLPDLGEPIMLPSSGVSSPLPMAARMSVTTCGLACNGSASSTIPTDKSAVAFLMNPPISTVECAPSR